MKKRRSRAFWERICAIVEAGGEPRSEVARRHRVSLGTLQGWIYRLRRERDGAMGAAQPRAVRVVPIAVTSSASPHRLSLHVEGAGELCFDEGTSPHYIAALAAALSPPSS